MSLGAVLTKQDGLLTRSQAHEYGFSDRMIHSRLASRRWMLVLSGVYATFTGELNERQRCRAALLWAGEAAMLGAATAARLHGLRYLPNNGDTKVHLLLPHQQRCSPQAFVVVRRGRELPTPWLRHDLPIAPPASAVVDTCRLLGDLRAVRALVAETVQRGVATIDQLAHETAIGGSAGSKWIRRALTDVRGGARSAPEAEWRDLVLASRLPPPVFNHSLYSLTGEFIARPDSFWEEYGVAVEIDSMEWHLGADDWERTMYRHERLAA
jgi:hypothetical protein